MIKHVSEGGLDRPVWQQRRHFTAGLALALGFLVFAPADRVSAQQNTDELKSRLEAAKKELDACEKELNKHKSQLDTSQADLNINIVEISALGESLNETPTNNLTRKQQKDLLNNLDELKKISEEAERHASRIETESNNISYMKKKKLPLKVKYDLLKKQLDDAQDDTLYQDVGEFEHDVDRAKREAEQAISKAKVANKNAKATIVQIGAKFPSFQRFLQQIQNSR